MKQKKKWKSARFDSGQRFTCSRLQILNIVLYLVFFGGVRLVEGS